MYWTLELASSLDDAPWPATKEELIDYIVVYEWYPGSFEENYETIDTFDQVMGEERNTYYLLRKKTLGQP